jgi:hypothetical protein
VAQSKWRDCPQCDGQRNRNSKICRKCADVKRRIPPGFPEGVLVSPEDAHWGETHAWYISAHGYVVSLRFEGGKARFLHRLIMEEPPGCPIDHMNGNKLDNRRENLRVVVHAENISNRTKLNRNNRSGYRGVTYYGDPGRQKRWCARVMVARRKVTVGYFLTPEEAAQAARDYRLKHMPGALS